MKLKALTWTTSCTPVLQIQGLTATFPMPDTSTKTAATRKYIVGGLLPFPPQSNHPLCGERFSLRRHFSVPPRWRAGSKVPGVEYPLSECSSLPIESLQATTGYPSPLSSCWRWSQHPPRWRTRFRVPGVRS